MFPGSRGSLFGIGKRQAEQIPPTVKSFAHSKLHVHTDVGFHHGEELNVHTNHPFDA